MVQRIYFPGLFLREASPNEDCNAVPELESHNLYLFFQAVQIKNQAVGWVVRPLDPEAVFPKENESGEVFGLVSYRDADSQRIQFEFAEFAANSFAAQIRCESGLKFLVLRIRGEFGLRIRRRRQNDHACAVFTPDEKLTLNSAMQYFFGLDTIKTMMILLRLSR